MNLEDAMNSKQTESAKQTGNSNDAGDPNVADSSQPGSIAGRVGRADRIQRLMIGAALMLLTVSGLGESADWRSVVALLLQTQLLLTGLVGWCPIYWACSTAGIQSPA